MLGDSDSCLCSSRLQRTRKEPLGEMGMAIERS